MRKTTAISIRDASTATLIETAMARINACQSRRQCEQNKLAAVHCSQALRYLAQRSPERKEYDEDVLEADESYERRD